MNSTRDRILDTLRVALEARPDVCALGEGGSAAFGRVDEWSDIDLTVVCEDTAVEAVFESVEAALRLSWPIELCWRVPEPTWHGHSQRFYRLRDAGPYLLLDLCVQRRSNPNRFTEPEQHGRIRVLFDREGLLVPPPFRVDELRGRMRADLQSIRVSFPMFQAFVPKELARGRLADAVHFYVGLTLRPLLTVLGMRHRPLRYSFGGRYLREDFPPELARELESLHFVADARDLAAKHARAGQLFEEAIEGLDVDALPLEALSAQERSILELQSGLPAD